MICTRNDRPGSSGAAARLRRPLPLPPRRRSLPGVPPRRASGGGSSGGGGGSLAAAAAAAGPSRPAHEIADDELLDSMLADGGIDGTLGSDEEAAIHSLRGGRLLSDGQRTTVYAAADNRMDAIDTTLDALDLKVADLYTSHHSAKIDMLHVQARVLSQVIWNTTDKTLIAGEEGNVTRSPVAWREVQRLTRTTTLKCAKDAAAEVIGASVAWRMCELRRPTLLEEFTDGAFTLDTFMRVARKVISLRLSCSQASGLTPVDARITLKDEGAFDWSALVDEAVAAHADKRERGRERSQRLRMMMRQAHLGKASGQAILDGLRLKAEDVLPVDPAERVPPMTAEVAAMLTGEERAMAAAAAAWRIGMGATAAELPAIRTRTTATRAAAAATGTAATGSPEAVDTPPAPREAGAAAAAVAPTAARPRAAAATTAGAAAATRRSSKRVASAVGAAAAAGADGCSGAPPRPARRPRLDEDEYADGAVETAAEPAPVSSSAVVVAGVAVVSARVAVDGIIAVPADKTANTTASAVAMALPRFTMAANTTSLDSLAFAPHSMVKFLLPLLHSANRIGLLEFGGGGGDANAFCFPRGSGFFFKLASAFEDAAVLVHTLDQSCGQALAPNRILIKGDTRLFGLGLGGCFTTFAMFEHETALAGGAAGASSSSASAAESWSEHIFSERALGTTMLTVFFDPDYKEGDDDDADGAAPAAFELVSGDGGGLRTQLRHGTVLISRAGGQPWTVACAAAASTGSSKKLREMRFFVSQAVVRTLCSGLPRSGGCLEEGGDDGDGSASAMRSTVHGLVDILEAKFHMSRRRAVKLFASATAAATP